MYENKPVDVFARELIERADASVASIDIFKRSLLKKKGATLPCLTIIVGEVHDRVEQKVFEILLLQKLSERYENIVCGLETPHDIGGSMSAVEYSFSNNICKFAPVSNKVLEQFLINNENNIKAYGTDVAYTRDKGSKKVIDVRDDSSANALKNTLGYARDGVSLKEPSGICARNFHMATALSEQSRNAEISIQIVGNKHVVGTPHDPFNPEFNSMAAHFVAIGTPVFALPANYPQQALSREFSFADDMEEGQPYDFGEFCKLSRISGELGHSARFDGKDTDIQTAHDEASYLNDLLLAVGMGEHMIEDSLVSHIQSKIDTSHRDKKGSSFLQKMQQNIRNLSL